MSTERLRKQLNFIMEIDKLKTITRRSYLADGSRKENDAEHSWHLAVMVLLLSELDNIDVLKTLKMVLIHDLVEIDAGDTYCYDETGNAGKFERECLAAKRLFSLLPEEQGREFFELWREFEERKTREACFAAVLDRMQPLLLNYWAKGKSWQENDISAASVISKNALFDNGPEEIRKYVAEMIDSAIEKGYLKK
ncbi:MAG TPA: HD domain-containing protein [Bacillota bacterium]|nr:HD domain-containing protein [Bacillota bacterium]HPT88365.1 HD domain-containing protein [Bacillota bacterium]